MNVIPRKATLRSMKSPSVMAGCPTIAFSQPNTSAPWRQTKTHLKLRAEPEVDDDVLVELAPDVEGGEHHGVHEEGDPHEERDHDAAHPVERQHEEVVSRPTVKNSDLEQFISSEYS